MTENYKDEMARLGKRVLKPSIYDNNKEILENLRVKPEPSGNVIMYNYAEKREISSYNSSNIKRAND